MFAKQNKQLKSVGKIYEKKTGKNYKYLSFTFNTYRLCYFYRITHAMKNI